MLALKPSQGWNYQSTFKGSSLTLTLYDDPNPVNGVNSLIASGQSGLVATVATSASAMMTGLVGALGVSKDASLNYNAVSELSAGSLAAIPGSPLLVPSVLTNGAVLQTYAGVTATVVNVGTMPNAGACPTPATGAQVRYKYSNYDYTIAYVPGCGITDFLNNANGAEFTLVSIGTYASIGQLSVSRRAASATFIDTAASLLGLRHTTMPAAGLLQGLLH